MADIRKSKVKKPTYRQLELQVKELEGTLDDAHEEARKDESYREQIISEVNTALENSREGYGLGGSRYGSEGRVRTLKEIPVKIRELMAKIAGMTISQGQVYPWIDHHMQNENAKLWYLVRAALKDETLKPADDSRPQDRTRNAFDGERPNFRD